MQGDRTIHIQVGIIEQERESEGGNTRIRGTEKQAVTESFSHTTLWPRSAREIKEEDYILAERLGSIFRLL